MSTRRRFSGEFKAKMALKALRGDRTVQEIAVRHKVHPNQVSTWKQRTVEGMKEVFTKRAERAGGDHEADVRDLHAKIGELTVERDFFGQRAQVVSREKRRAMIRRDHSELSFSRQYRLLSLSRSSLYHTQGRECAEPGADAPDRWAVSEVPVLPSMAPPRPRSTKRNATGDAG